MKEYEVAVTIFVVASSPERAAEMVVEAMPVADVRCELLDDAVTS